MDCFVGVEFAVLYGILCLVAANGDFCVLGCDCNERLGRVFEKSHISGVNVGHEAYV